MAKQIRRQDIVEDDIFKVTRESAQETLVVLDKLNEEFKASAKVLNEDIKKATLDSAKSIETFVKSTEKATKLKTDSIKVDEQTIKIKQQLAKLEEMEEKRRLAKEKADGQAITNAQKIQREEEKKAKAAERVAKAAANEASAYKQLEKNTRELKNQSKELAAQMLILEKNGQRNSKEYRNLAAEYKKVTAAAQQGDQALKKIDSTVGDNFRNVGNYSAAVSKLSGLLGQLGIAFGFGAVAQKTVKVLASFDEGVADMAKTLNIGTDEAKKLAQELLKIDTRTSVENLQQIATIGGQLGISSKDIVGFTNSVDKLNVALGDEFTGGAEEITSVIGGLRNVFSDLKSDDVSKDLLNIGNALNVLGADGAATAPVMADFASRIGGVGIPLGLTSGQVLGLSSTLQELNVNAERGGTAIGNILKKMAQDTEGFAKFAGVPLKEFEQLVNTDIFAAFEKVVQSTKRFKGDSVSLAKALDNLKVDGAGASEVFLKLGSNIELLDKRTGQANKSLTETGSITDEFGKKNETLQAKIDKVKNAIDKYILGVDQSGFATGTFGKILDFLAQNFDKIFSIVGKLVVAWGAYKAIQLSLLVIEKARNFSLVEFGKNLAAQIPMTKAYKQAQQEAAVATNSAGTAAKTTGNVMKSIPWVAIAGLVIELAMAFYDVASGAARAREQAERLDNYRAKASETAQENITKETEALNNQIKKRNDDLRIAQSQTKSEIEKQRLQKESLKLQQKDIQNAQKQVRSFRDETVTRLKSYRAQKVELEALTSIRYGNRTEEQQKRINQIYENLGVRSLTAAEKMKDAQDILTAKITAAGTKITEYNKGIKTMGEMLNDTTVELTVQSNAEETDTKKKVAKTKAIKGLNNELDKYNEYLTVQTELLNELEQIQTEQAINELTNDIEAMTEELQMMADAGVAVNTSELQNKLKERLQLELDLIDQKLKAELEAIDQKYEAEKKKAREQVEANYQKLISQQGLTPDQRSKIDQQYKQQLDLLAQDELQINADKELEMTIAKEKGSNERLSKEKDYNKDVINMKNDLNDRLIANDENKDKKTLDNEKKNAEDRIAIINAIAEAAIRASQRRVEQIEKEIATAESQADYFKELAAQGNIDAKQSLAEQNKIIAEANQRKEAELRKQQRIQFANTVFQTYQKNSSDENIKNPLAKTITDVTLLSEFIKNFPMFLDGTEDTGSNGQGLDGKGGFHAILHPNERVMTKEQNSLVGDLSNEALAKLAHEYNTGSVIHKGDAAMQLGGAWSTAAVIKKLDELESAIKSKPETNIELGEIIDGAMTIVKSKKQGNSVIYNRYKVK